ncbi:hypothetical protein [Paenibacillus kribbensis]|uniref:Uncharacterized protein n=1 Tax=Paenibacillus kribbensis TaxID=172713 RepID=A0A222WGX5_9BACL|nr:hypothetical protein [Paenibacillus kribbensis]ASR45334.1 hypothetical protein B4V02_00720 [Paenibacillus kribbensis]
MKSFRFWLVLISILVIIVNVLGYDDYNILLAIISPLVWIYESFQFVRKADIPIAVVYLTTLGFWYLIGYVLDRVIRKLKSVEK